jgi:hypothetical protein
MIAHMARVSSRLGIEESADSSRRVLEVLTFLRA